MLTPDQAARLKNLTDRQQAVDRETQQFFEEALQPLLAGGADRNKVTGAVCEACADAEGQHREMPSCLSVTLMLWGR